MGSKTFDGVWFLCYADDHAPPHGHGAYSETTVIVDLLSPTQVRLSGRADAVQPRDAKRSDVRRILRVAATHAQELWALWERMHGATSN